MQSNGLHAEGKRYIVLKADERSLYGKQVRPRSPPSSLRPLRARTYTPHPPYLHTLTRDFQGKEGLVIVKTTQAILVTHYPGTVQPGAATNTVEQLADYLISVGY